RVAKLTGGMELMQPGQALRPLPTPGATIREIWMQLLLLAALLLPLDVALRRIALPFNEIWSRLLASVRTLRTAKTSGQQEFVGRLSTARKRANATPSESPPAVI